MIFQIKPVYMKISDALEASRRELKGLTAQPRQEGLWILGGILKASPSEIYLKSEEGLSSSQKNLFLEMLRKRREGRPLDYLLGESFFFGQKFFVKKGVFIPRPDTEIIVERALKLFSSGRLFPAAAGRPGANLPVQKNASPPAADRYSGPKASQRKRKAAAPEEPAGQSRPDSRLALRAADFGAGAGAICLSLLREIPESRFAAVELSRKALECLRENSRLLKAGQRLHILKKDVSLVTKREMDSLLGGAPDLITANPPYISPKDRGLSKGVRLYEPPLALFSDQGGLGHIYSWFEKAMELLRPGGAFLFEFGYNQSGRVQRFLARQKALSLCEILQDRGGRDRAALCFKF